MIPSTPNSLRCSREIWQWGLHRAEIPLSENNIHGLVGKVMTNLLGKQISILLTFKVPVFKSFFPSPELKKHKMRGWELNAAVPTVTFNILQQ